MEGRGRKTDRKATSKTRAAKAIVVKTGKSTR